MLVPVHLSAGTGREVLVYAMLDNMSDACYVSSSVIQMLQAQPDEIEERVTIHTINGSECVNIERYDRLILRGYTTSTHAQISAYRRDHVSCTRYQQSKKAPHLEKIAAEIPLRLDIPVGLLIGANHPEILQPLKARPAPVGATGYPFRSRKKIDQTDTKCRTISLINWHLYHHTGTIEKAGPLVSNAKSIWCTEKNVVKQP